MAMQTTSREPLERDCYHRRSMTARTRRALRAPRPLRAALVGAPAVAGFLWNGGLAHAGGGLGLAAVTCFAWALALAAFLWNDRADLLRGTAAGHRRAAVRELVADPGVERPLLWMGLGAAAAAVALGYWLAPAVAVLGVLVAASGWLYSDPVFFAKARPWPALLLHAAGGAANAAAGAWAAGGGVDGAVAWGVGCGALFSAAHLVHVVADRQEDRAAGVGTMATARTHRQAARLALVGLGLASAAVVLAGWTLGGARGLGLAAMGLGSAATLPFSSGALHDPERWHAYQRWCRLAVAAAAAIGVGLTMVLRGEVL